jgi:tetratricopeptide (TPR) repeat protein
VLTLCMLPTVARAGSDDIIRDREAAFRLALEHLEAGRHREAIPILRSLNEAYPGGTGVLWNLGQATSKIGEHSEALTYWLAFRALEPDDWHVHSKLVQTYQALGDRPARDREREALYRLRKAAPAGSELATLDRYVREQFTSAGRRVMVFEFFEPSGPFQVFYSFVLLSDAGEEAFRVSLGSYERTTQFSRETGWVAPDQRVYHLDGYGRNLHTTYAFFDGAQPSYEVVRAMVQDILSGKRRPTKR